MRHAPCQAVGRPERPARPNLSQERRLWQYGLGAVAGVDEVGIGPLAGPVVAAAVMFPAQQLASDHDIPAAWPQGVRDSKTLTHTARQRLDLAIRQLAQAIGIGLVEVEEIDRINIYQAGLKAMRLAVERLSVPPQQVLVDGRHIPELACLQTAFPKGDRNIFSIAAASIIAKVYRDRLMIALDRRYPHYGFAGHKGYGTASHRAALREFGPCPAHRRSFRLG